MEALFSIVAGIAVVASAASVALLGATALGAAWGVRRLYYALKGEEYKPLFGKQIDGAYEHQDVDTGATDKSIESILRRYSHANVVGSRARAGVEALENERRKRDAFMAVLERKFQPNSLSWNKFAVAADMTHEAVLRNCASLANRIQVFDRSGYQKKELGHRSSTWRERQNQTQVVDPVSAEKQRVLQAGLDEMDAILRSNDQLLTELDKLTLELGKLTDAEASADTEHIVDEIRTLIDQTQYYGQQLSQ